MLACYTPARADGAFCPFPEADHPRMDEILNTIGETIGGFFSSAPVQFAIQSIAVYIVILWLAAAYWAFRDMQLRSENPILPYLAAALIVAGAAAVIAIPKESAPEVIVPIGIVTTTYPGVSALDIEELITKELEPDISNLDDIDSVTSSSRDGVSVIVQTT